VLCALEQPPRKDAVEDMLDSSLSGARDPSQIEMPVGFDDKLEVPRCPANDVRAIRKIFG
jgi:hypothetical protein